MREKRCQFSATTPFYSALYFFVYLCALQMRTKHTRWRNWICIGKYVNDFLPFSFTTSNVILEFVLNIVRWNLKKNNSVKRNYVWYAWIAVILNRGTATHKCAVGRWQECNQILNHKYRRSSLFAVLVFTVLLIRGLRFDTKSWHLRSFPLLISGFWSNLA